MVNKRAKRNLIIFNSIIIILCVILIIATHFMANSKEKEKYNYYRTIANRYIKNTVKKHKESMSNSGIKDITINVKEISEKDFLKLNDIENKDELDCDFYKYRFFYAFSYESKAADNIFTDLIKNNSKKELITLINNIISNKPITLGGYEYDFIDDFNEPLLKNSNDTICVYYYDGSNSKNILIHSKNNNYLLKNERYTYFEAFSLFLNDKIVFDEDVEYNNRNHEFSVPSNNSSGHSNFTRSSKNKQSNNNTSSNIKNKKSYSDPYDVNDFDNGDDFADEWGEEFGDGNFDEGADDAYDYWEDNHDD